MRTTAYLIALSAFSASIAGAQATDRPQIGSTVAVVNHVMAEYDRDRRNLQAGDRVHQDEVIEVGDDSKGELMLDDSTMLVLGPKSRLLLDEFVYNGARTKGDIAVNLLKGAFRFITGSATRTSYRIRTPVAAITVRGTIFDVYLADTGLWLLLLEGGIRACNDQGTCRNLSQPGQILHVGSDGSMGQPSRWASLRDRDALPFDTAFPFVTDAPVLDPDPVLTRDEILAVPALKPPRRPPSPPVRTRKPGRQPPVERQREAYVPDSPGLPVAIGIDIGLGKIGKHRRPRYPKWERSPDESKLPRFPSRRHNDSKY
ncbi:MAG: FecR domain-containing protein [Hyphomicrobiaceae bacterium]|nr:FecR domain-containing protein [Hyphomicrobiaceae bacterium]